MLEAANMTGKAILLDVDGVVMHHPRVLHNVSKKITTYVRKNIPKHVSKMDAEDINRILYKSFGHSHRGLERVYGPNVPPLAHFLETIYDEHTIRDLWNHRKDPMMQQRATEVLELMELAAKKDTPVYLFSNSPEGWCDAVSKMMKLDIHSDRILCAGHPVFKDNLLKPDAALYEAVATYLRHHHREEGIQRFVFVDDSWGNLVPVLGGSEWIPILLKEDGPLISTKRVHTVRALKEVASFLH